MATDPISYDKADLRGITRAFKAMDEGAVTQAKAVSNGQLHEIVDFELFLKAQFLHLLYLMDQ